MCAQFLSRVVCITAITLLMDRFQEMPAAVAIWNARRVFVVALETELAVTVCQNMPSASAENVDVSM